MALHKDKKIVAQEESIQVVTFRVGSEEYGIEMGSVSEVVRPLKITPLPRMPMFVEGVVNLRGSIIPVIDLRRRFELKDLSFGRKTRMVMVKGALSSRQAAGGLLSLVVDSVQEVLAIPKKQIEPPPEAALGPASEFITGVGKVGERLIILLDILRLLSSEEQAEVAEAGKRQPGHEGVKI